MKQIKPSKVTQETSPRKCNVCLGFCLHTPHTHTHTHIYIYIYVCVCVCVRTCVFICVCVCVCVCDHHIVLVAQISLTLSRHSSLSFIALGRSSGQHPVSSHSCWMYVLAGCPAFARPCVGVHKSTSLMSSSLLLQQCPACLAPLPNFRIG